jgi:phosphoribosylformylglycinamidine synthase
MKAIVIAFPGNNCENETRRACLRNGFDTEILRWNEIEEFKNSNPDLILLPGGFSFEDRGRSGAIAAREPIFEIIRDFAKKGKIILGICNGAQMVVESGLIPVRKNPIPFALAKNVRRNKAGQVLGTGFYNEWIWCAPENKETAFTKFLKKNVLKLPIAHGEGRFCSCDKNANSSLKSGKNVAFRYCDEQGNISEEFPITPNGSIFATTAITNSEGTIMAIMPHPERYFEISDGDDILQSIKVWIEKKCSPSSVEIGDFSQMATPEIKTFQKLPEAIYFEKKLIITDNENFSIQATTSNITGTNVKTEKTILFEITGENLSAEAIANSGLVFNSSKEFCIVPPAQSSDNKFAVAEFDNDEAKNLAEKLSELLNKKIEVRIFKIWDFANTDQKAVIDVLQNRLLANPNSAEVFKLKK